MEIAIIVGHNDKRKGFYSPYIGKSEYEYYKSICNELNNVDIHYRLNHNSYSQEIDELCDRLNSKNYDIVVSMHFNSFDKKVQGSEAWCYHSNEWSKQLAWNLLDALNEEYGIKTRGVKSITNMNNRGGRLFYKCKHPVILFEPFFGDEPKASQFKNEERFTKFFQQFINCM